MLPKQIIYLVDYIPQKSERLSKQQLDNRQKLLLFMEGDCTQDIKDAFVEQINKLEMIDAESDWIVGFIPAPNEESTLIRYGDLALDLGKRTECEIYLDLFLEQDSSKDTAFLVNRERVEGRNVILIDALITTGKRYRLFRSKLKKAGAKSIYGIIVGKAKERLRQMNTL